MRIWFKTKHPLPIQEFDRGCFYYPIIMELGFLLRSRLSENLGFCDQLKSFLSCIVALRNEKRAKIGCKRHLFSKWKKFKELLKLFFSKFTRRQFIFTGQFIKIITKIQ